jgi:hypothetical protein
MLAALRLGPNEAYAVSIADDIRPENGPVGAAGERVHDAASSGACFLHRQKLAA